MAINFITDPGGLFVRLGKIATLIRSANVWRGPDTLDTLVDNVINEYLANTDAQALVAGATAAETAMEAAIGQQLTYWQQLAQATVIDMADDQYGIGYDLKAALGEVIAQMLSDSETISKPTAGAAAVPGNLTGGQASAFQMPMGSLNVYGAQQDYMIPETLRAEVERDANHGAIAGSERIRIYSPLPAVDPLSFLYPGNSGIRTHISMTDPQEDNARNMLTNSSFESWSNVGGILQLDNWALTFPENMSQTNTTYNAAPGTFALQISGSADNTELLQLFGDSGTPTPFTPAMLRPNTVYACGFWYQVSAIPAAGALLVSIMSCPYSTPMEDDNGNSNAIGITLSSVIAPNTWYFGSGLFVTPTTWTNTNFPPALDIKLTTPLSAGKNLIIDGLAFTPAYHLYKGGPYVAAFRGRNNPVQFNELNQTGDYYLLEVTNDFQTSSKWAFESQRLFDLRNMEMQLPSSGTPGINETLIT